MVIGTTERVRGPKGQRRNVRSARVGRHRTQVLLFEGIGRIADSCRKELEREQFEVCRRTANSARELVTQCLEQPYGAIVCGLSTDGPMVMEALALVRQRDRNIPLIVLIDAPDLNQPGQEDTLTDCMLQGATDCVDRKHLSMLPVAVAFAVEQRALTEQRDHIERDLERSRARYEARSAMNQDMEHAAGVDRG
jgi:DNA-binding NtrC family response regulator